MVTYRGTSNISARKPNRRKFNGLVHKSSGLSYTKANATKVAAKARRSGTRARVVQVGKKSEYQVYYGPHFKK